jgi:predicted carbohydrate-binding protein with CBM5 and CBM33 domain
VSAPRNSAVSAVPWLPQHREPDRADEHQLGEDDGHLAAGGKGVEEGLHSVRATRLPAGM